MLPSVAPVIFKNEVAQTFEAAVIGIPIIYRGKLLHKLLEVRVRSDHKSSDRNFESAALSSQSQGFVQDFCVEPKAVLVVADAFFYASRLPVGDHENLLVPIFSPAQQIHGQLQTRYGIGVVGPNL